VKKVNAIGDSSTPNGEEDEYSDDELDFPVSEN